MRGQKIATLAYCHYNVPYSLKNTNLFFNGKIEMKYKLCSDENCSSLGVLKPVSDFYRNKNTKDGYKSSCKECQTRNYRNNIKIKEKIAKIISKMKTVDDIREYLKEMYISGKTAHQCAIAFNCQTRIIYHQLKILDIKRCPSCKKIKKSSEEFYKLNKYINDNIFSKYCIACDLIKGKKYRESLTDEQKCIKDDKRRLYVSNNRDHIYNRVSIWNKNNPQKIKEYRQKASKKKLSTIHGNLNNRMTCGIRHSLKTGKEGKSWKELVDFTLDELKEHLELHFQEDMSWNNMGQWHIDHIIPKSHFNITGPYCKDFKMCWFLLNLQPLWAEDNSKKSDKLFDGSRCRNRK
jgi:hypothetical protein